MCVPSWQNANIHMKSGKYAPIYVSVVTIFLYVKYTLTSLLKKKIRLKLLVTDTQMLYLKGIAWGHVLINFWCFCLQTTQGNV